MVNLRRHLDNSRRWGNCGAAVSRAHETTGSRPSWVDDVFCPVSIMRRVQSLLCRCGYSHYGIGRYSFPDHYCAYLCVIDVNRYIPVFEKVSFSDQNNVLHLIAQPQNESVLGAIKSVIWTYCERYYQKYFIDDLKPYSLFLKGFSSL